MSPVRMFRSGRKPYQEEDGKKGATWIDPGLEQATEINLWMEPRKENEIKAWFSM
jgi:hypothetical protein